MVGRDVSQPSERPTTPERQRECESVVVDEFQVEQHVLGALTGPSDENVEQSQEAELP